VYVFAYTGLFIIAFSSVSNFGLLARQRVQLMPLFLVLLSLPFCLSPRSSKQA
jgi:hypothetical protein